MNIMTSSEMSGIPDQIDDRTIECERCGKIITGDHVHREREIYSYISHKYMRVHKTYCMKCEQEYIEDEN